VLAHRYPEVPDLGDMTTLPARILSGEVPDVDVFIGGTPCQSFSVAGLRKGLADPRGQLTRTFVEIIDAIDTVRSAAGKPPTIALWENVPGVLSDKDNAFGNFLGALCGEDDALLPAGPKWTNAGSVLGPRRSLAWRVLDAQHFGVAQRRRRVFLVAGARAGGIDPVQVLLVEQGVCWDPPSRGEAQPRPAAPVAPGAGGGGLDGPDLDLDGGRDGGGGGVAQAAYPDPAYALSGGEQHFGTGRSNQDTFVCSSPSALTFEAPAIGVFKQSDVSGVMLKHTGMGSGETQNPAYVLCANEGVVGSLTARGGRNAGMANDDLDARRFALQPRTNGSHWDHPSNAHPSITQSHRGSGGIGASNQEIFSQRGSGLVGETHSSAVLQPRAIFTGDGALADPIGANEANTYTNEGSNNFRLHNCVGKPRPHSAQTNPPVVCAIPVLSFKPGQSEEDGTGRGTPINIYGGNKRQDRPEGGFYVRMDEDTSKTLDAATGLNPTCSQGGTAVMPAMAVRRLTPVECERLQGFPDHYTDIPWKGKPAGQCPDGPRYKALGNSMAVPVIRWIGLAIARTLETTP
jgi:DNA (cytosine-5)-methyltransferase 1